MNIIRVRLIDINKTNFDLGYVGEKNHTKVTINCASIFRDYPDAVATMVAKPPQGDLYPVNLTRDGSTIIWEVTQSDIAYAGSGQYQLTFTDGTGDNAEIIKTVYGQYSIKPSLTSTGEPPEPLEDWLQEATAALETFETEIGEVNKITTASLSDVGKALSPKTVVSGKVTAWEYVNPADPEAIAEAVDNWLDDHPEATTTVQDGAITEAKLNSTLKDDLAWQTDVDGLMSAITRPEFIVGNAEEVLSDRGETDEAVYLFRKTGGTKKAYNREQVRKLVGGTVAWNQMFDNTNSGSLANNGGSKSYDSTTRTWTVTQTATGTWLGFYTANPVRNIIGHKYLVSVYVKPSVSKSIMFGIEGSTTTISNVPTSGSVVSCISTSSSVHAFVFYFNISNESEFTADFKDFIIIDLTAALGSTIADYLYTLETQTAGSGVALFRSLFGKSYYQFNSGSLESVNVSEHRCVGFNQWDEEWEVGGIDSETGNNYTKTDRIRSKNFIPAIAGAIYKFTVGGGSTTGMWVYYYDKNKNFISPRRSALNNSPSTTIKTAPENTCYIRFEVFSEYGTTYHNDICVNLSDTNRNGQYEPYQLYEYAMPNVTLRGIPKLVNNEIVFDGDELTPDGAVKRRYALVDLSTLSWTYVSTATYPRFSLLSPISGAKGSSGDSSIANMLCKAFTSTTINQISNGQVDKAIAMSSTGYLWVRDSSITDIDTFITFISGVYLVYELATPTTESADPYQELQVCSRYGTEEYVDRLATAETSPRDVAIPCGHETFYLVNVFDYIDEHLSASKTLMELIVTANREEAMKATKAYSSGNLIIVNGTLYRATTSIANGATLTVGTNVTATNIATELANLA